MRVLRHALCLSIALCWPGGASAQGRLVGGHVALTGDALPHVGPASELRARLYVERRIDSSAVSVMLSGWAEGLLADREGTVTDATARPHELFVDVRHGAFDLRAGLANIVWGRLDEIQPSDVINPLDVSKFLFEGRSEARLPVLALRGRWFFSESTFVDGVWVPVFRRGRFDQLDEPTSPFNLARDVDFCLGITPCTVTVERREPVATLGNSQGGLRLSTTTARVDWSLGVWRGFQAFGVVEPPPLPSAATVDPRAQGILGMPIVVAETFPRLTLVAGDFETVRGDWGVRGEVAAFVRDVIVRPEILGARDGHSVQAGLGADWRTGENRFNGSLLLQHRDAQGFTDTDVSVVAGGERSFAQETRVLRVFGAWNVSDGASFLRTIARWNLRESLWLEGSIGWFFGEGDDLLSRFETRDFVYVKLKRYF
jgi:hypothetical protein